ncbi:histidinol dehydrogenase [Bacteroidetes bacterium endosymbiont of Geopemphigus sp.]|uniref:histidinol dehydrogenase n=1 Tax=Bacteroidetes bacterium endosymbiont of Geopemphigus sp. TaxID=2047937 RepID=UPI000CD2B07C|nr:histidinol dehydrogenase [Bacteroidetes bacterium endosymbiont of Geopemphigus sp.]
MEIPFYLHPAKEKWLELIKRPNQTTIELAKKVQPILKDVKTYGNKALRKYTEQWDRIYLKDFQISKEEIDEAQKKTPETLKKALFEASENIKCFHQSQIYKESVVETMDGVRCWRKSLPIEKVGLYIPGGSAPLFSTVLMLGIPAQLAGCQDIVLCSPPDEQGKLSPVILYAAEMLGIKKIYKVGGAQAIAAMAYGTESIPSVYKIFGPGNTYVTKAKELIAQEGVAIDMPAGPSELAILADATATPAYVAADLLSQAEHGKDSQVLLISDQKKWSEQVVDHLKEQIAALPRKSIASEALKNSCVLIVKDLEEGMELINTYAPEHLIINCKNSQEWTDKVKNAGSVFLGNFSPESAGDYASGTNHTLPTSGHARAYSGLSVESFVKKITFQELSKKGLQNLSETIEIMAQAERLIAHQQSVTRRLKS